MSTITSEETSTEESNKKRKYKTRNRMSESEKLLRDLEANYKSTRKMLLKSLENCNLGTGSHLQHLKALDDQFLKYAEFRRDIGILPKNIASQTVTEYKFRAVMGKGGSVRTVPLQTKQQALELDRAEEKQARRNLFDSPEDEAARAQLEAEFGDSVAQPKEE